MSNRSRKKPVRRVLKAAEPQTPRIGRELKIALCAAIPFGIAAAFVINWQKLFPVPPEKLVEVVWTHECSCVHGWMRSLRDAGFVVRDFEQDDLKTWRERWDIPNNMRGCHPARFIGYFIEGHVSPAELRQLAQQKPPGRGLRKENPPPAQPDGVAPVHTQAQTFIVDSEGRELSWSGIGDEEMEHRHP